VSEQDCWGLVVAAGVGARFGVAAGPKQYQQVAGKTLLEHAVDGLLSHPLIAGVVLVLAANDSRWEGLGYQADKPLLRTTGGSHRAASVLNGLQTLAALEPAVEWVVVHDGVRPCLPRSDLDRLVSAALSSDHGAVLATPLTDTLKRVDDRGRISETVPREGLYRAQTPQMFRLAELNSALIATAGQEVTDEAAAMELAGLSPMVVAGSSVNIKVTVPEELALVEALLVAGRCE